MKSVISHHKINAALKALESVNQIRTDANSNATLFNEQYNCWGFTAFVKGFTNDLYWMDDREIMQLLKEKTYSLMSDEQILPGDIAIYGSIDDIVHTAVVVYDATDYGDIRIIQKPGRMNLEITTINQCFNDHGSFYGDLTEYRRTNTKLFF